MHLPVESAFLCYFNDRNSRIQSTMKIKSLIQSKGSKKSLLTDDRIYKLYSKVLNHIDEAKKSVQRTIDTEMVKA